MRTITTQRGFTILEVLVSLSIFSIASVAIAKSFTNHLAFNKQAERRSGAITAVQQVLDGLRVLDPSTLPTTGTSAAQNVTVGNKTYAVTTQYCRITSYCSSANVRFLTVKAKYRGTDQYTVDTIYSQLR